MLGVVDKSKTEVIAAQQKVVKLQEELLVRKDEELKTLQSNVTSTVQSTVQHEIRTYSAAVKSSPPQSNFCEENLKTVVRDVIEKEDRSKNLIIHGLKEETGELLSRKVSCLFEELGEKPKVEVCRIGREITEEAERPVKVVFSNSTSARVILLRSKNLKQSDQYKTVYVTRGKDYSQTISVAAKEEKGRRTRKPSLYQKWQCV